MEQQPSIGVGLLRTRRRRQDPCRPASSAMPGTAAGRPVAVLAIWLAFGLATHHLLMGAEGVALAAAAPVLPTNAMPATSGATIAPTSTMSTSRCCVGTCSGAMSSCPLMFAEKPALPSFAKPLICLSAHSELELTADRSSCISSLAARKGVRPPTQALLQVFLL